MGRIEPVPLGTGRALTLAASAPFAVPRRPCRAFQAVDRDLRPRCVEASLPIDALERMRTEEIALGLD